MAARYLQSIAAGKKSLFTTFSRSYVTASSASLLPNSSCLPRIRPLVAASGVSYFRRLAPALSMRGFATRHTSSSLNDPNPNWSNRPPKETILLDGCDFEHWLVVVEKPEGEPTRDEIIDSYIKTLATVVGSEEEARMKIYSVSTKHYFAFGALVSEEVSYKLKEIPKVRWVLPDSYLNVREKDYGGEPFINGQAVPYDPKYHEEWVRNNARANERNRRNDRPRNFDRSRNFERRRENYGSQQPIQQHIMSGPTPNGPNSAPMGGQPNSGPNMTPATGPSHAPPQPPQPNRSNAYPPQHNPSNPGQTNMGWHPSYGQNVAQPPNAPNHGPMQSSLGGQMHYGNNVSPQPNAPNHGPMQANLGGQGNYGNNVSPPPNTPDRGPGQPNFGVQQNYGGGNPGYMRGQPNNGPYHSGPSGGGAPYPQGPGQNQNGFAPRFEPGHGQYQNPNQGPNQTSFSQPSGSEQPVSWGNQGPNQQNGYAPNVAAADQPQSQNVPGRDIPPRY